jgi:hypothetical protein
MKVALERRCSGPDLILLDDESIIRDSWLLEAEAAGLRLLAVASDELLNEYILDPITPTFVDYDLGSKRSGLEVAKELKNRGHSQIVLISGYEMLPTEIPNYISATRGKAWPTDFIVTTKNAYEWECIE